MGSANHSDRERAEHYRQRAIELVNLMTESKGDERLCRRLIEVTRQYLGMADGFDAGRLTPPDRASASGGRPGP